MIWSMPSANAIAVRPCAWRELEEDGAASLYLLSMIVRHIRILVQVSDQMAQGLAKDEIAKAMAPPLSHAKGHAAGPPVAHGGPGSGL